MRFKWVVQLVAVVSAFSSTSYAATDNACWNRDVEHLDYYLSPLERGDNNFFTSISNTAEDTNVVLLYPAKASLKAFTQRLYRIRVDLGSTTPTGCGNEYFNTQRYFMPADIAAPAGSAALQGVYSAAKVYPDPGPTYSGGRGQPDGLAVGQAYRYLNWPANGGGTAETVATACTNAGGAAQTAACQACVATKGYWLNPLVADNNVTPAAGVFSTNFLRFNPVKWTLLSLAYKRLINGPLLSILREGVVGQNNDIGGQVVQKMLPQSCNGVGRPMLQKQTAIDTLTYTSNANPMAEMLFNAGWYMGGQASPWVFSNAATQGGPPMATGNSGPCNSCNGDFIVLFSDGRGDTANPACTQIMGVTPPYCSAAEQCSTLGMGEGDGDHFLIPTMLNGAGPTITGAGVRLRPGGTCDMDFADDVAGWMHTNNMSPTGPSRVATFVVGIGDPKNTYGEMTTLQEVANSGGGQYVVADDFAALERNIESVLRTIISRTTSFTAAAITTVQTKGYTSTFVPRFRPSDGSTWQGTLSRFDLFNEFSSGCTSRDYGARTALNPNGDQNCSDLYLTDSNSDFIGENASGSFVLLDTTRPYDAGWPIKLSGTGTEYPAVPVWEASEKLNSRAQALIAGGAATARRIYTVAPDGSGGYTPTLVPFTTTNVATITPLLKLGGVAGDSCSTLAAKTRHTYATEDDCARDLIDFIHGHDVLLQNPYNRTVPLPAVPRPRLNILGDIFHSVPVLVSAPTAVSLCELGVINQCIPSLFSSRLTPGGSASYSSYATTHQYRTQFVLVGANDGMVHAFNAGNDTVVSGVHRYDLGTGNEIWAFIPPDMLPKLIRYMIGEAHELLVDGAPMVRDIWADGSGAASADRVKQADEFHTLAIFGEREGGRSYFALDVTDATTPKFKWMWPPPGTTESMFNGETWNDIGPSAAPIGPIAEYHASGPFTVNGVKATERYIVAVGGGHDAAYMRGRAIYVLDAWTGGQVFRFSRQDAVGAADLRNKLFPVAAPITLADINQDGLFDTAVVGDTGGQVWTVAMQAPGVDANADGRYDNWFAARAFVQFKGDAFYKRSPFYQRANAGLLPDGTVRLFLGAGDRNELKETNGGVCGIANLSACVRKNCTVTAQASAYRVGPGPSGAAGGHYVTGTWSHAAGATEPTSSFSFDSAAASAVCSDVSDADLRFTFNCNGTTASYSSVAYCDWGAGGGADCPIDTGRPLNTKVTFTPAVTIAYSRFYSVLLYGSGARAQFSTAVAAAAYDAASLTETNLIDASVATASASGNGWWLNHAYSIDEKTASAGLLLGGCIIWNTLKPTAAVAAGCANVLPLDTAYTYQADALTGAIACGAPGSAFATATVRATARSTYVAPQQFAPLISVNSSTGEISYGAAAVEPGSPPRSLQVGSSELWGTVHRLQVPRKLHDCRHGGTNCQ